MRCFHPQPAIYSPDGKVRMVRRSEGARGQLELRCGQCIGCRMSHSASWATRIMHEAQLFPRNAFVTLTFDDEHVPSDYSLDYSIFQRFMKRFRKAVSPLEVRFFMCGEYGQAPREPPFIPRPHFHAAVFNWFPDDAKFLKRLSSGHELFTSAFLSSVWTDGFSSVGELSFESAAYIARYVAKKISISDESPDKWIRHYARPLLADFSTGEVPVVVPEFARMSLKPGIGFRWFQAFRASNYRDYIVVNGSKMPVPRYYSKLLEKVSEDVYSSVKVQRYEKALEMESEGTPDRLRAQEAVAKARLSFKVRPLR